MICKNCGNEIRDDAKFCPHCGRMTDSDPGSGLPQGASPYSTSAYTGPEAPVSGGGKKKGLIIGGVVAAVAVVAVLVVMVSGMFSSAKGQVEKAVSQSLAAYVQAWEALDIPDLTPLTLEQSYSQRFSLRLEGLDTSMAGYDMSALTGLGLRFGSDLNGKDRKLGMELAAFWDEEDIISFQMAADDNELYFSSPELTDGEFYGVNTETLGADLSAYGVEDAENVSFNLFDLVDIVTSSMEKQLEAKESLKEANKALSDTITVKKQGSETLDINGTEQKTTSYRVTIPQEAMEDYADAVIEVMESVDYVELYEEIFRAAGMSETDIRSFLYALESADPYGEMRTELKDFLDELGDVELDVCLFDGYVAAVRWSDTIRGTRFDMLFTLGGGGEYVDDLGLELTVDSEKMTIKSTGDHGSKGGAFTDQTTMRVGTTRLTSDFRYAPGGAGNNLTWTIGVPGSVSVDMEGRMTTAKDSMDLQLENLSLKFLGIEMVTLSMDYYAGPYDGQSVSTGSSKLITELDGLEMMALGVKLQTNAQSWLTRTEELFVTRLPAELLQMLM